MRNSKNHASKQRQLIFRRRLAGIALWHPGDFQKESIKEKFLDCASFLKYGKLWNMCPHVSTWRPKKLRKIKQFRKHEDGVRMTSDTAELFCVKTKTKPEPLTEPRHQRSTHQVVNSHHRFTVTLLSLYCVTLLSLPAAQATCSRSSPTSSPSSPTRHCSCATACLQEPILSSRATVNLIFPFISY